MRLVLYLSSALFLLLATNAFAWPQQETPAQLKAAAAKIANIKCSDNTNITDKMLTEAVYICVKDKMNAMAKGIVMQMFDKAKKVITAMLTLAVMFFGIKFALFGTRQPQAEFFAMMIKTAVVAAMLYAIPSGGGILLFRDNILNAGAGLQKLVMTSGAFKGGGDNLFAQMDNALCEIYGIADDTGKCKGLKSDVKLDKDLSGIAMMGGLLMAGPLGSKAFVNGGAAIGMLVGAFLTALFINIVSLIALTFLLGLSPLILPLTLFNATDKLFQKWRGQIISYSLQPMIAAAFLSMMFLMLGNMLGTADNAAGTIKDFIKAAKDMGNDPGVKRLNQFVSTATTVKGANKPNQAVNTVELIQDSGDTLYGPALSGIGVTHEEKALSQGFSVKDKKVYVVQFDEIQLQDLATKMVALLILCMVMFRFLKEIPSFVSELSGSRDVPNLAESAAVQQVERKFGEK